MSKVAKDIPLSEITLRRYEKPSLQGRDLVKKFCLTLGLLQPGDSRDIIVDIFYTMLNQKKQMNSEEVRQKVIDLRKEKNLALVGVASSNIRRQLKRLRELYLIEKVSNNYRITENLSMNEILKEKIERFMIPMIYERVREYFDAVEKEFSK
jgi:hypothetical protein